VDRWTLPILLIGAIAIVAGVFLLRGAGWGRWLILGWLAFHVVVSLLNSLSDGVAHLVLLFTVGYFLLAPPGKRVFSQRRKRTLRFDPLERPWRKASGPRQPSPGDLSHEAASP
jgi:hypothetical protein